MCNIRYNFFLFIRTLLFSFRYADWKGVHADHGILGLVGEFFRSLVGVNTWPIFIPTESGWGRKGILDLFKPYGIRSWGWGYSGGRLFFRVKKRQALWAEYILRQNYVPMWGAPLEGEPDPADLDMRTGGAATPIPQRPRQSVSPQPSVQIDFSDATGEINRLTDAIYRRV